MTDVSKNMDALQERILQSTVDKIIDVSLPQVRDNLELMESVSRISRNLKLLSSG